MTYCIAGSPTSSVNRAANAERDMAVSRASAATDQGRAGWRCTSDMARPMRGSCRAPSQPVCPAGSPAIHERIAWMTRMSDSRVITASPPGRSSRPSAAMSRSVLCIHSASGDGDPGDPSMTIVRGSSATRLRAAGWPKRTVPHTMLVGAPPPP